MKRNSWEANYNAYLKKKHDQFKTDKALIGQIVKKATDSEIEKITKIVAGEVNEVYDILTISQKKLIVRISRSERLNLETEKIYIDKVRALGVPAPKVLLVERVQKDLTFCVEEKIQGVPFRDSSGDFSAEDKRKIIHQAGGILSKIHSLVTPGYGTLSRKHLDKSWMDFIHEVRRNPKNAARYEHDLVDQAKVDKAIEIILSYNSLYEGVAPTLLHADYGTKHWLIENKQITGILDFEGVKGGDPLYDFAWLDFFQSDTVDVKELLEGYENKDKIKENFDFKIKLYDLVLSLRLLEYYISENNVGGVGHCVKQLDKGLKNFK